jgi:hypothetical protein
MQQEFEVVQQVYELVINFLVTYSFQIAGAVVIVVAGFIVGSWVSRGRFGFNKKNGAEAPFEYEHVRRKCATVADGPAPSARFSH